MPEMEIIPYLSFFSKELLNLIEPHKHKVIFVVGLGNRFITPDALGPNVSDAIDVNRHLSSGKNSDFDRQKNLQRLVARHRGDAHRRTCRARQGLR